MWNDGFTVLQTYIVYTTIYIIALQGPSVGRLLTTIIVDFFGRLVVNIFLINQFVVMREKNPMYAWKTKLR